MNGYLEEEVFVYAPHGVEEKTYHVFRAIRFFNHRILIDVHGKTCCKRELNKSSFLFYCLRLVCRSLSYYVCPFDSSFFTNMRRTI